MPHTNTRHFPKQETPFPLGRNVRHDSRSRSFTYPVPVTPIRHISVVWPHSTPVLNQGSKSSCVGNAGAQFLNCDMYRALRGRVNALLEAPDQDLWLTESDAITLYSMATHNDGFGPDQYYPPNDQGASGLGVAQAMMQLGYLKSYQHCFTMTQLQAAIQNQPVIIGTSWTNAMFDPDPATGIVTVGALNDQTVVGGHEYLVQGIDYQRQTIVCLNSWGPGWGGGSGLSGGQFRIRFSDVEALLADEGDIVVPRVVSG
jgi:hypothetical protein